MKIKSTILNRFVKMKITALAAMAANRTALHAGARLR